MGLWLKQDDGSLVPVGGGGSGDGGGPHDHDYLPLAGGTLAGALTMAPQQPVWFGGNWENARIYNSAADDREYMVIGQSGDGAGINLYGDSDTVWPGNVMFYAGSEEVGLWDGPTGKFVAYRDVEVQGALTVVGKINGALAFGIAPNIDTADVLDRAETATMPVVDDEGVATTDAEVESITVNEVVTALLAKVKQLSARIETLEGN